MPPRKSRCLEGREMGELPESILQHILSFLDYTDAVRASAVSKNWKSAVSTLQCLNISDSPIRSLNSNHYDYEGDKLKVSSMLISAGGFVSKASNQNLHVQKFSFKLRGIYSSLRRVKALIQCLNIAGCDHIEEFTFEIRNVRSGYKLPWYLFAARSLHKLVLLGLELSLSEINGVSLPSLKLLELRYIRIDNGFLEQLLMNCPDLEILKLQKCHGFHALKVLGPHHKLKRIDFEKNSEGKEGEDCFVIPGPAVQIIEIKEAPFLENLRYHSKPRDRLNIIDVAACKNLKVLELSALCDVDKLLNSIEHLVLQLNVLETFKLHEFLWPYYGGKETKSMTISSNSLRELWLGFVGLQMDVLVDVPHLSEFRYMGLISNLSFGASPRTAVKFVKCKSERIRYDKVVEFLQCFNHFEAVKLDDFPPRLFKVLTWGHNLDPPLWGVKHLNIGVYDSDQKYMPGSLELLEGLLWMAPQLDSLTFHNNFRTPITFQFVRENSRSVEKIPFTTQRNILIKIKVESSPGDQEGFELKKYFFKYDDGTSSVDKAEEDLVVVQVMSKVLW